MLNIIYTTPTSILSCQHNKLVSFLAAHLFFFLSSFSLSRDKRDKVNGIPFENGKVYIMLENFEPNIISKCKNVYRYIWNCSMHKIICVWKEKETHMCMFSSRRRRWRKIWGDSGRHCILLNIENECKAHEHIAVSTKPTNFKREILDIHKV